MLLFDRNEHHLRYILTFPQPKLYIPINCVRKIDKLLSISIGLHDTGLESSAEAAGKLQTIMYYI